MPDPLPSYRELTFDFKEYPFECPDGIWRARLVAKAWGKGKNILLYFRKLDTNKGHCIAVFHSTFFAPIERAINFRQTGEPGEVFELETGKTRTGRTRFLSARLIEEPESQTTTDKEVAGALTPVS
jgi:hypothetical protein